MRRCPNWQEEEGECMFLCFVEPCFDQGSLTWVALPEAHGLAAPMTWRLSHFMGWCDPLEKSFC
jgi:hypothetical protein